MDNQRESKREGDSTRKKLLPFPTESCTILPCQGKEVHGEKEKEILWGVKKLERKWSLGGQP